MATHDFFKAFLAVGPMAILAACGGGGGIASAPTPVAAPAPSPTPPPTPLPPPAFAPQVAKIFSEPLYNPSLAVAGKGWQHEYAPNVAGTHNLRDADSFSVSYDQATGTYQVSAPVAGSGTLYRISDYDLDPVGANFAAVVADSAGAASGVPGTMRVWASDQADSKYSYVSYAWLYADAPAGANLTTLAYGAFGIAQPTRAGEVPITGSARYSGHLFGQFAGDAGATWLSGTARFDFDFAQASLTGELKVTMPCMMGCLYDDVVYALADTRFARGDTNFSGNLTTAGAPSAGSFSGLFAGPAAAELMSQFQLPYFNPEYQRWMPAGGVILGKRD